MFMCYEATRDLKLQDVEIETPICRTTAKELQGKKMAVVPILRAGLGMVDGMTELIPAAEKIAVSRLTAKSVWGYVPDENLYALRAFFKAGYQVNSVLSLPDKNFQVLCKMMEAAP